MCVDWLPRTVTKRSALLMVTTSKLVISKNEVCTFLLCWGGAVEVLFISDVSRAAVGVSREVLLVLGRLVKPPIAEDLRDCDIVMSSAQVPQESEICHVSDCKKIRCHLRHAWLEWTKLTMLPFPRVWSTPRSFSPLLLNPYAVFNNSLGLAKASLFQGITSTTSIYEHTLSTASTTSCPSSVLSFL